MYKAIKLCKDQIENKVAQPKFAPDRGKIAEPGETICCVYLTEVKNDKKD
jgi:hypothetical protein